MGASTCKAPCNPADPAQDTVQVNPTLLQREPGEKAAGLEQGFKTGAEAEEERLRAEQEAERQRIEREREEALRIEKEREERLVQEKIQRERAEAERQRQEKLRLEKEEAERKERERVAAQREHERLKREEERRIEQERIAKEQRAQREAEARVQTFLKTNGFKGVTEKRTKMCSSSYPLHTAVAQNSVDTVKDLLRCGADAKQKNSAGQTAFALAEKCNKKGKHDAIVEVLRNA